MFKEKEITFIKVSCSRLHTLHKNVELFERGSSTILEYCYKILLWFMSHFTAHKKKTISIYSVGNST